MYYRRLHTRSSRSDCLHVPHREHRVDGKMIFRTYFSWKACRHIFNDGTHRFPEVRIQVPGHSHTVSVYLQTRNFGFPQLSNHSNIFITSPTSSQVILRLSSDSLRLIIESQGYHQTSFQGYPRVVTFFPVSFISCLKSGSISSPVTPFPCLSRYHHTRSFMFVIYRLELLVRV